MDLMLRYRECGSECREDWLRMLACDNELPLAEVLRAAARFGERQDFCRLVEWCEGGWHIAAEPNPNMQSGGSIRVAAQPRMASPRRNCLDRYERVQ